MKKNASIIILTIVIFFISCNQKSSTIMEDGDFLKINAKAIIENKNLPKLIDELEETDLKEERDFYKIPKVIADFYAKLTDGDKMANANEKWNSGDITIKNMPTSQLQYFGAGKNIAVMTYYRGGIGKSTKILIFKFDDQKVRDFWCGTVLVDLKNKNEIIQFLKKNMNKKEGLNTNTLSF